MRTFRIGGEGGRAASRLCLGALHFGSKADDATSFAILDRFVDGGGTLVDTANSYVQWVDGCTGDESETTLGRWLARPGARDKIVLATKVGARGEEGLAGATVRRAAEDSLGRLGTDRIDLYWAHVEDRTVPLEETLGAFAELASAGKVGAIGASNHAVWRLERARALSRERGWPAYVAAQHRYSYLQPRPGAPLPERGHTHVEPALLDYVRSEPDLDLFAYTTLLFGAYTRPDRTIPEAYEHPGTARRLEALRAVSAELGATPNQVVLAWLLGGDPPIVPIVGVSTVEQIEEALGAADLELPVELRERLDGAC